MIKLGILEADAIVPEYADEYGQMGDWFVRFLSLADDNLTFARYESYKGNLPRSRDECSAWLITGSSYSVRDKADWLNSLRAFVKGASPDVPVVGVCFGHQLMHQLHGGVVERSENGWGIGLHEYTMSCHPDWMEPRLGRVHLLTSHADQVTLPASSSRTIASSSFCPIAMSLIGENILTLQPHPELDPRLARAVYKERRNQQGAEVTDAALSSMNGKIDDLEVARWIVGFLRDRIG